MNDQAVDHAQSFLTVISDERTFQIVNIEFLLRRHPAETVVKFLNQLRNDYRKQLRRLLRRDVTHPRINEIVARCFRIKMAVNTIQNGKKNTKAHRFRQGLSQ